jgi:signal transduction histidine kinase
MGNDAVRVAVDDNGRGFEPEAARGDASLGLRLIRERAEMLGGTFDIDSAVGKGARIVFTVPIHS